ncbi:MAG: ribosome recycling factor [Actinobacteria bacterium]|nr:ribosome recycling factor [Actinomycetota bacterium]
MKDRIIAETNKKMDQSIENTQHEFNTIRTGRASVALLDSIYIDYYGTRTLIKHAANINVPEARTIVITPYEPKLLKEFETQIIKSNLGINPTNDGKSIRLAIPPLNEERRLELVKLVKKITEDGRITIRNIRRDTNDEFKKMHSDGDLTEDDLKLFQKEVQDITDGFIVKINNALEQKEKEIMEV